jgi:UDP-2,3-diacylglucosamine hydrolase
MTPSSRPDPVLLIADLHLEPARPDLCRAFSAFLDNTASGAAALYILGDLFNVWIGDDDDTPLYTEISAALKLLSDSGTAVYLIQGNRDFLLGPAYAAACGATLLAEPHLLLHHEQRYLLLHGDVLCTRDTDYQTFRTLVRNPRWQADMLARSLAERRSFAEQARSQSKSMSSNKAEDIMDVSLEAVEALLHAQGVDTLIHGHTHRPALHQFNSAGRACRRLVLGDWDAFGWYARLDGSALTLERFAIQHSNNA